jgi:hypothetical protein
MIFLGTENCIKALSFDRIATYCSSVKLRIFIPISTYLKKKKFVTNFSLFWTKKSFPDIFFGVGSLNSKRCASRFRYTSSDIFFYEITKYRNKFEGALTFQKIRPLFNCQGQNKSRMRKTIGFVLLYSFNLYLSPSTLNFYFSDLLFNCSIVPVTFF